LFTPLILFQKKREWKVHFLKIELGVPPDGSNWENLCIYCHDDEHSRSILADYLSGKDRDKR
jgi:hypothetical protein